MAVGKVVAKLRNVVAAVLVAALAKFRTVDVNTGAVVRAAAVVGKISGTGT